MKRLTEKDEVKFPKSSDSHYEYTNRVMHFQYPYLSNYITNSWELLMKDTNYMLCEKINQPSKRLGKFMEEYKYDMFDK